MANGINLPKTRLSKKADFITIIQDGVEKNISKLDLLKYLEDSVSALSSRIENINSKIDSQTIDTNAPNFAGTVSAATPSGSRDLTTKNYVDSLLENTIKKDGTTMIESSLAYRISPTTLNNNEVVPKSYLDSRLLRTLKTVQKLTITSRYPRSVVGDTYIIDTPETTIPSFAVNGPEIQRGDIIICVETSAGGAHREVGHQFAIVNTNVVLATETSSGTLRVATEEELQDLTSNQSAITPFKYKRVLEQGSEYSRETVNDPIYSVSKNSKGIIGVDSRYNPVTVNMPRIADLDTPLLTKFIVKDEHLSAVKNNITIKPSGSDSIQKTRSYNINDAGGSVKLYNDGVDTWYVESTASASSGGTSGKAINLTTDDTAGGEYAAGTTTSTGYTSVLSIVVDLKDYPIGTGFKVVAHAFAAATANDKSFAIGIGGTQTVKSSSTGLSNPNGKFIHSEVTLLHSNTAKYFAYGFTSAGPDYMVSGLTNNLELNWDGIVTISADVNVPTAENDIRVYALQVIPIR